MGTPTASASDIHGRLRRFLGEEMERAEHHQCVKLELLYTPPGSYRREPLKTWHRSSAVDAPYFDPRQSVYLDQLTNEMIELAEYHADTLVGGKPSFKVVSHHAMGGGRHHHNFVVMPASEAAGGDLIGDAQSLDPSTTGVVHMLMRHVENQARLNRDMMQGFASAMREAMNQSREENERLHGLIAAKDAARAAELQEIEAARSKQHEQQIEAQLVVSETERKTFATKKIVGLLPVLASRFLEGSDDAKEDAKDGKASKGKKWKPSALSVALGELAESLDDDQQEIIEGALDIEQKIMLGEAIRLAKKGGGPMLSQIVFDLFATMKQEQLTRVLQALTEAQRPMVMRAIQLAKAEAEPDSAGKKTESGSTSEGAPPNGA